MAGKKSAHATGSRREDRETQPQTMKVMQVLPEMNAGGVERGTLEVAAYLVKQGHEAIVISNGGRLVEELEKIGAKHITMPVHRKSIASLFQVRPFRKLLEQERPDILHIRSRVPGWIAWLAWRGMDPAKRPRLVSTVHGFYSVSVYSAIMTKGERIIAVSESVRDYIHKNYPATSSEKIRMIHRGINPALYPNPYRPPEDWLSKWWQENPHLRDKELLLLPGRITRLKGHEDFFHLIAALKNEGRNVHGLIAGDTHPKKRAYLEELKKKAASLGIADAIEFLGHRPDVREVMAVSRIVLALSQQPESFGRTVLEAMAIGKPVVGYDCGGVAELLDALFPAGKVPLADAENLLHTTREILESQSTPADLNGRFTLDAMCRRTLETYQQLSAETGRPSPC